MGGAHAPGATNELAAAGAARPVFTVSMETEGRRHGAGSAAAGGRDPSRVGALRGVGP